VTSITGRNFGSVNQERYSEHVFEKSNITCVAQPNAITSPNNTFTGIKLTEDASGTGGPRFYENSAVEARNFVSGVTYTVSAYFKAGTQVYGFLAFRTSLNYTCGAVFNLTNGTVASENTYSGWTNTNSTITPAGNGWYRCTLTSTAGQTTNTGYTFYGISDGTAVSGAGYTSYTLSGKSIYLWGMQREESSTATDYIKSDVNWTSRASNATYYDVNGTLKKSSYNLLLQSEDFSTTWLGSAAVTTNTADSPFGELSADTLTYNSVGSNRYQNVTTASSTTYTFSVWMRAVTGTFELKLSRTNAISWTGATVSDPITLTTEWQRYSLTFTTGASDTASGLVIGDEGLTAYNLPATGSIYAWGAQLEKGTYAGDYAKTEGSAASTARTAAYLPDGNGNFVSAGDLLLEGAGTNLLTYSEDFSQSIYQKINITASSYTEDAPDGSQTAALFLETTSYTGHFVYYNASQSITQGTTSVWVKPLGRSFMSLRHFGSSNNWLTVVFDVTGSGSVTDTQHGTLSTYTDVSSDIESYPNGWYRLSVTASRSGGLYLPLIVHTNTSGTPTFNSSGEEVFGGDTAKGFYIWGAQLEESPYATSYIPTTGSTATRAADVSTSAATFGNSWYEQSEGTVFAETIYNNDTSGATAFFNNASYNNLISLQRDPSLDRWQADYFSGGSRQALLNLQTSTAPTGIAAKTATSYKVDSFNASANGGAIISDASGLVPVGITRVSLGFENVGGGAYVNGTISRLTYWPTRLSNDTLQTITT
jgi:hypothetical protein